MGMRNAVITEYLNIEKGIRSLNLFSLITKAVVAASFTLLPLVYQELSLLSHLLPLSFFSSFLILTLIA